MPSENEARPRSKARSEGVLRILVWNIYKGFRTGHFEQEFLQFALNKDLVFLQEAVESSHMKSLWEDHLAHLTWNVARSFRMLGSFDFTGVALGSRSPPLRVERLKTKDRELYFFTPKSSLLAEILFEEQKILVVCTHLLNFVSTHVFSASLYEIVARMSSFHGPIIFAGDFNTWNLKRYLILKNIMTELGFQHVEYEKDERILRLDHLFIRGLRVNWARIHQEIRGSDHLPIEAELILDP